MRKKLSGYCCLNSNCIYLTRLEADANKVLISRFHPASRYFSVHPSGRRFGAFKGNNSLNFQMELISYNILFIFYNQTFHFLIDVV